MAELKSFLELRCPDCGWHETCGLDAIVRRLREAGKLRPGREPEPDILYELFHASASRFTCPACGRQGLLPGPSAEEAAEWPDVVLCASCSKPIPKERLEAIPGTTLCAACQGNEERGLTTDAPDYCPRCGAPMKICLTRSGGITRYVLACTNNPPCRR